MSKDKTVQILIANGVEEMEAIAAVDLLRRAGVEVQILSLETSLLVEGRNGIRIEADAFFKDEMNKQVDMIIVPGGPSHLRMLDEPTVLDWIRKQEESGQWIASICAGPKVLKKAGVLSDKKYTSHYTTAEDLPERLEEARVFCDGKIVTSQGAGTATDFALALVGCLCGKEEMESIRFSISF